MKELEELYNVKANAIRSKHVPKFTGQYKNVGSGSNPEKIFETTWVDKLNEFSPNEIKYLQSLVSRCGASNLSEMRKLVASKKAGLEDDDQQILMQIFTGTGF